MFFDKQSEDDFFFSLGRALKKQHAFDDDLKAARRTQLQGHLKSAAELLRNANLNKEAQMVAHVYKINEAEQNFSAEQVVAALESFGWDYSADSHDADTCSVEDCAMCKGDDDLTEDELKAVRKLLKKEKKEDEDEGEDEGEDEDDAQDEMNENSYKALEEMFKAMDPEEQDEVFMRFKKLQ